MNKKRILNIVLSVLLFSQTLLMLHGYQRKELLPDSSGMVVRISNAPQFGKAFKESPLGQLWNSPKMKPFFNGGSLADAIAGEFAGGEPGKPGSAEIARLSGQELDMLEGEFVLSFGSAQSGVYIVAAMSEENFEKSLLIDRKLRKLKNTKKVNKTHTFQGVKLVETISEDETGSTSIWQTCYKGSLVQTSDRDWLEKTIVRLKKAAPAEPKGLPVFQLEIAGTMVRQLAGTLLQASQKEKTPQIAGLISAMGLEQLESILIKHTLRPDAATSVIRVLNNGEMKGVWAMLKKEPVPFKHRLAHVPEKVYSYQVTRLDFNAFWLEMPQIINKFSPAFSTQFDTMLTQLNAMLKVDISRDFFGNLDTLLTTYSIMDRVQNSALYAVQLREPAVTEKFLDIVLGENSMAKMNMEESLQLEELAGHRIYVMKFPVAPTAPQGQVLPSYALSVADGSLVLGEDKLVRTLIHNLTSKKKSAFYSGPLFKSMIKHVPDHACSYAFFDMQRWVGQLLTFLETFKFPSTAVDKQTKKDTSYLMQFMENLQPSKLPSAEFISSFFGKGFSYNEMKKNEYRIVTTSFYPAKNKRDGK
ncbi:MAG: hypothetical protein GY765_32685 [bacterium]|nr:hypothetical protein [bacterium]